MQEYLSPDQLEKINYLRKYYMFFCGKMPLMQKYGELLRLLLEKRGITDEKEAEIFFNPDYERDILDPFLMRDMEKACVRIYEAIEAKEKIVIYADYDCDGIPGAVVLQDLFNLIGYSNFQVYIPQRNSEGYGLNMTAIDTMKINRHLVLYGAAIASAMVICGMPGTANAEEGTTNSEAQTAPLETQAESRIYLLKSANANLIAVRDADLDEPAKIRRMGNVLNVQYKGLRVDVEVTIIQRGSFTVALDRYIPSDDSDE